MGFCIIHTIVYLLLPYCCGAQCVQRMYLAGSLTGILPPISTPYPPLSSPPPFFLSPHSPSCAPGPQHLPLRPSINHFHDLPSGPPPNSPLSVHHNDHFSPPYPSTNPTCDHFNPNLSHNHLINPSSNHPPSSNLPHYTCTSNYGPNPLNLCHNRPPHKPTLSPPSHPPRPYPLFLPPFPLPHCLPLPLPCPCPACVLSSFGHVPLFSPAKIHPHSYSLPGTGKHNTCI